MTVHEPNSSLWYDSVWIQIYAAVGAYLSVNEPKKLKLFEELIAPLRTDPNFQDITLKQFLSKDRLQELRTEISNTRQAEMDSSEFFSFGRHRIQDAKLFTDLQVELVEEVSSIVGEEVEPSYNFLSLYHNFGECPLHMDSPEAKWTVDICIEQSIEWPIHFSKVTEWPTHLVKEYVSEQEYDAIMELPFCDHVLHEGDAVVFSGSSQWHYRKPIPKVSAENFCHLIFLHYIPVGSRAAIDPKQWAAHLNEPAIDLIVRSFCKEEQNSNTAKVDWDVV